VTQRPPDGSRCLACDLASGVVAPPGGTIHRTDYWIVEHCIGPLRIGSLVVKPIRHVVHVADLQDGEVAEMGPLLHRAARAVTALTKTDQVYVCLWSHAERKPGHVHFVVQPVSRDDMSRFDAHGPALQVAMFAANEEPAPSEVEAFSERAASWFSTHSANQP
jgi:diadenosine tetraphosphate (Ap4A) HIT family hydrolase